MTRSCSRRSGATPTFSARGLNPPIITFVGRLHASQKGHDTFLEALRLLEAARGATYSAWLVGGSVAEASRLADAVGNDPSLAAMHGTGRLTLWGRVSAEALPEIYSRSTVVAMPSRRETFGLVAVEAMLCKTPVAAAAVGGLLNTIVPRVTGAHFEAEDGYGLAFILQSLLSNRRLADWLGRRAGRWADEIFGRASRAGGFPRILDAQAGKSAPPHPLEEPSAFWASEDEMEVQAALGADVEVERLPSKHHSIFRVVRSGVPAFVKLFTERPDFDSSVYRFPAGLTPALREARMTRTVVVGKSAVALCPSEARGRVLVHPWCEPAGDLSVDLALDLADGLAATGPVPSATSVANCADALQILARAQDWRALDAFDVAAARMNAPLTGSGTVFVRCHPEAEIVRLSLHVEAESWPLRPGVEQAMSRVLSTLRRSFGSTPLEPRLQHGDLTDHHIMCSEGRLVLVDLEDARFGYGDLDRGRLAFEKFLVARGLGASPESELISPWNPRDGLAGDAVLWFACEAFHRALGKASWGSSDALSDAIDICEEVVLSRLKRQ